MSENHNEVEQIQEENRLIAERRAKLSAIREKRNAFPNHFRREDYADRLQAELGDKDKEELETLDRQASIAGRIMAKRGPFMVLQDMTGRIQVYVDKKQFPEELADEIKTWDIGDIISATGPVHKSGKGDLIFI
jgi:lysyl-tRNA synthetase class 2